MAQYVFSEQQPIQRSDSTLSKIGTITEGASGLIQAIDQALHPGRYRSQPSSGADQQSNQSTSSNNVSPKRSGMGVMGWALLLAAGGGALYAGREFFNANKKTSK